METFLLNIFIFYQQITKDVLISSHTRYDTTIVNSFRPLSSVVGCKLYFYSSIRRRPRAKIVKEENSKRESRKCNEEWRPENSHWFYFIRRHEQQGEQSFPPTVGWFSFPALACSFCLNGLHFVSSIHLRILESWLTLSPICTRRTTSKSEYCSSSLLTFFLRFVVNSNLPLVHDRGILQNAECLWSLMIRVTVDQ